MWGLMTLRQWTILSIEPNLLTRRCTSPKNRSIFPLVWGCLTPATMCLKYHLGAVIGQDLAVCTVLPESAVQNRECVNRSWRIKYSVAYDQPGWIVHECDKPFVRTSKLEFFPVTLLHRHGMCPFIPDILPLLPFLHVDPHLAVVQQYPIYPLCGIWIPYVSSIFFSRCVGPTLLDRYVSKDQPFGPFIDWLGFSPGPLECRIFSHFVELADELIYS